MFEMRRVGGMLLIALAWLLWPAQAQAQAFPCTGGSNGAGPGERMVGMSPATPSSAPFPICVRDGSAPAAQAAPDNSFAAIAWHADAADVWVVGNFLYEGNPSEKASLDACNKVMGGGCTSTGQWWNSPMSIIRNANGSFYKAWAGNGGGERRQVLADCTAKQMLPCEVFATISSRTRRRSPDASVRKSYVASAWVAGSNYNGKIYVASGYRSSDAAWAAAVKACSDATSRQCEVNAWTGNGFIQAYRMGGTDFTSPETSARRAKEAAQVNCRKLNGKSCEIQASFDSRKPGLFVHDFAAAKAP